MVIFTPLYFYFPKIYDPPIYLGPTPFRRKCEAPYDAQWTIFIISNQFSSLYFHDLYIKLHIFTDEEFMNDE